MAKKKSSPKTTSHWHKHHSVTGSLSKRPFLTLSVIAMVCLLFGVIYLTLFVKFKYQVTIETNTQSAATLLEKNK